MLTYQYNETSLIHQHSNSQNHKSSVGSERHQHNGRRKSRRKDSCLDEVTEQIYQQRGQERQLLVSRSIYEEWRDRKVLQSYVRYHFSLSISQVDELSLSQLEAFACADPALLKKGVFKSGIFTFEQMKRIARSEQGSEKLALLSKKMASGHQLGFYLFKNSDHVNQYVYGDHQDEAITPDDIEEMTLSQLQDCMTQANQVTRKDNGAYYLMLLLSPIFALWGFIKNAFSSITESSHLSTFCGALFSSHYIGVPEAVDVTAISRAVCTIS